MRAIIEPGWEGFRQAAISPAAGPNQLSEMRKAFYAGVVIIYTALLNAATEPGDEAGVAVLEAVHAELEAFEKELKPHG